MRYVSGAVRQFTLPVLVTGVFVASLLGSSGCATGRSFRGRPIPQERVEQIVKGKTTTLDIIQMFGSPTHKAELNGKWVYTYKHTKVMRRGTFLPYWSDHEDLEKSDELTISFDENGVVETSYLERGM